MSSLVILGSSGFLGSALLAKGRLLMPIKAVARHIPPVVTLNQAGITWFLADLLDPASLRGVVGEGDIVINLAYMTHADVTKNVVLIDNIIEACIQAKAARLVHCSTAVVVGATKEFHVDETSPCVPVSYYGKTKLVLEKRVQNALSKGLDTCILRPTAIIGPGGQNLIKLARALQEGNAVVNYLRACLFGRRPMHLVSVHDVVKALLHLAVFNAPLNGNVYIVSSDEDPDNNFLSVEDILLCTLGMGSRKFPLFPFPKRALALLLKLLGRSEATIDRVYVSRKLRTTNFKSVCSVAEAVREFAEAIRRDSPINRNL